MKTSRSLPHTVLEFESPSRPCPVQIVLFIICKCWFVRGLCIISWYCLMVYIPLYGRFSVSPDRRMPLMMILSEPLVSGESRTNRCPVGDDDGWAVSYICYRNSARAMFLGNLRLSCSVASTSSPESGLTPKPISLLESPYPKVCNSRL